MVAPDSEAYPKPNRWLVRGIAVVLAFLIWLAYVNLRMDQLILSYKLIFRADQTTAIPLALIVAYAVAACLGLFVRNRNRLGAVFRPNLRRCIGAVCLALLTTYAVIDWVPISLFFAPLALFVRPNLEELLYLFGAIVAWYPVSCLIVSGIKSWPMRFGLFSLRSWANYAGVVLWTGAGHPICC